uniref:Tetratricopeptide repeat protein n=1 Tax=Ignavibacterium album TaxID=591197 RepID=A0A832G7G7_9BACT
MLRFFLTILFSVTLVAQTNPLKSDENRKLFADHLYCQQDYLRAAEEYEALSKMNLSDTILYKIGKSYSIIGNTHKALNYFSSIQSNSSLLKNAILESARIFYLAEDSNSLDKLVNDIHPSSVELKKLLIAFYLKINHLDKVNNDLFLFDDDDMSILKSLYERRKNPAYKSETVAGILSAIIPGSGKIYTENFGDGITAFILTGIFSYLAYDNFKHSHQFRAYLFSGLAAGFYLGNIYGSVASAQIFNAKVNFNFLNELTEFLSSKNYFINEIEFCK